MNSCCRHLLALFFPLLAAVNNASAALAEPADQTSTAWSMAMAKPPALVLIIDDVGHSLAAGQRALRLPGAVSVAILPFGPNSKQLAEQAHALGKEVLLHLPMSTINGRKPGPGALVPGMSKQEFEQTLDAALTAVPHRRGVNNHMGSQLTQQSLPMAWLMQSLRERGLYFVDSRTSALSVAERQARTFLLPHLRRDVFLDNQRNEESIRNQFELLVKTASKKGLAVGIGHPYPETLRVLERQLPTLALRGIQLVSASVASDSGTCIDDLLGGENHCGRIGALEDAAEKGRVIDAIPALRVTDPNTATKPLTDSAKMSISGGL